MSAFFAVIDAIISIFILVFAVLAVLFMAAACILFGWTLWKGYHLWEDLKTEMNIEEKLPHIKMHLSNKLDEILHLKHV